MFIPWWVLVIAVIAFFWLCWSVDKTNDRINKIEDRLHEAVITGGDVYVPEVEFNARQVTIDISDIEARLVKLEGYIAKLSENIPDLEYRLVDVERGLDTVKARIRK